MTTTQAKARMAKRRDRFVVGYVLPGNALFTSRDSGGATNGFIGTSSIEPMTKRQAERLLAQMPCAGCAILELVPVQLNAIK